MITDDTQFQQFLDTFPASVHEFLKTIPQVGGVLAGVHCQTVMDILKISVTELMLRLLPAARQYSRAIISDFQVGAVAKARMTNDASEFSLFLGANLEFPAQALTQTIHAEQSAVINAWLQGAKQIDDLAVNAAPCGCCRQFLYELEGSRNLTVILHDQSDGKSTQIRLSDLLPAAFGPHDLGSTNGLMASGPQLADFDLKPSSNDPLVREAKAAAKKSYAPYSRNFAGCAIKTAGGKIYAGRYAENAAFNPSLSALHTAIISMTLDHSSNPGTGNCINRAILVERPTATSQCAVCELLLQTVAPNVNLEYFEAL